LEAGCGGVEEEGGKVSAPPAPLFFNPPPSETTPLTPLPRRRQRLGRQMVRYFPPILHFLAHIPIPYFTGGQSTGHDCGAEEPRDVPHTAAFAAASPSPATTPSTTAAATDAAAAAAPVAAAIQLQPRHAEPAGATGLFYFLFFLPG